MSRRTEPAGEKKLPKHLEVWMRGVVRAPGDSPRRRRLGQRNFARSPGGEGQSHRPHRAAHVRSRLDPAPAVLEAAGGGRVQAEVKSCMGGGHVQEVPPAVPCRQTCLLTPEKGKKAGGGS